MADRVRYAISVTPIETLTDENNGTHDVISGEVGKTLGSSGEVLVNDYSKDKEVQGYLNNTVYYFEAIDSAESDISTSVEAKFIFIRNTGYTYSADTVLGVALDLSIQVTIDTVVIAVLEAGESIVFKDVNGSLDCRNFHVRTVNKDGTTGDIGHLAVEFLVVS